MIIDTEAFIKRNELEFPGQQYTINTNHINLKDL